MILNNLIVLISDDSPDLSCANLLLEIRKPGDEHGCGNISIQSDCGIHRSAKTLRRACSNVMYIDVCTRCSQRALCKIPGLMWRVIVLCQPNLGQLR